MLQYIDNLVLLEFLKSTLSNWECYVTAFKLKQHIGKESNPFCDSWYICKVIFLPKNLYLITRELHLLK